MTDDPDLPRGIALAWGIAANPQRGPKRELSIERIVDAAIEIADAGGLSAVSMASVATSLGFTPMSLYRYVSAKDDLVMLMQDRATGLPPETIREAGATSGWRAGLAAFAAGNIDTYRRHPWVLDVPVLGVTSTPHNAAWLDSGLEVLAGQPIGEPEKVAVTLGVLAQTRWQGTVEKAYREAAAASGDMDEVDRSLERIMKALLSPEQFPWIAEALAAGAFSDNDVEPFTFGIERLLDGVEVYLERRGRGEPPPARVEEEPHELRNDPKVKDAARRIREAEKALAEARKREREALKAARDRLRR